MLRRAAERSDQLILGNSQELPLRDACFDVAFCRSLLHHLPRPALAVSEMHRVLRRGGELVLVDTNASILSSLPRRIMYRSQRFSGQHRNMNRRMLERLLRPYFAVDRVVYFGYLAYPLIAFPDAVRVFKYVPFKAFASSALMCIDRALSRVPLLRAQSWGILIKGTRR
jgi:SAM-dependent methyltransferase